MTIKMNFDAEFQSCFGKGPRFEIEVWDDGEVIFTTTNDDIVRTTIDALEGLIHDAKIWMSVRSKKKGKEAFLKKIKDFHENLPE